MLTAEAAPKGLENYTLWERNFVEDVGPGGSALLLADLELKKVVYERVEAPILWQVWFLGGRTPASGHFAELTSD